MSMHEITHRYSYLSLLQVFLLLVPALPRASGQFLDATELGQFLLKANQLARNILENSQISANSTFETLQKDGPASETVQQVREIQWTVVSNDKYKVTEKSVEVDKNGLPKRFEYSWVSDGMRSLTFNSAPISEVPPQLYVDNAASIDRPRGIDTALLWLAGYDFDSSVSSLVKTSKMLPGSGKIEKKNGFLCFSVSFALADEKNLLAWFRTDTGVAVYSELQMRDKLILSKEITAFIDVAGFSFPKQAIVTQHRWDTGDVVSKHSVNVDQFEAKPNVPLEFFNTSLSMFPAGTHVYDRILGVEYILGEGAISNRAVEENIEEAFNNFIDKPLPLEPKAEEKALPQKTNLAEAIEPTATEGQPLLRDRNQTDAETGRSGTQIVILAVVAVIIAGLFVFLFSRRARRGR